MSAEPAGIFRPACAPASRHFWLTAARTWLPERGRPRCVFGEGKEVTFTIWAPACLEEQQDSQACGVRLCGKTGLAGFLWKSSIGSLERVPCISLRFPSTPSPLLEVCQSHSCVFLPFAFLFLRGTAAEHCVQRRPATAPTLSQHHDWPLGVWQ